MSARLNAILLILLLACALALVKSRYLSRRLYYTLEQAQEQSRQLDVTWSQLTLDRSIYGKTGRIQEIAADKLGMIPIKPARIQYMSVGGT